MTSAEAVAFIRPAVCPASGRWADLGAGTGTFTRALASLMGDGSRVLAVDRNPTALRELRRSARGLASGARVEVVAGDLRDLSGISELADAALDGALFANSLHYLAQPEQVLASIGRTVRPGGRIVVIEYERETANRWVPFPLPVARLRLLAERAGLMPLQVIGRRPSAYQGEMYCALTFAPGAA